VQWLDSLVARRIVKLQRDAVGLVGLAPEVDARQSHALVAANTP